MNPEEAFESFLKRNRLISSSFQQIVDGALDPKGRRKLLLSFLSQVYGILLPLIHTATYLLPKEEAASLQSYAGNYVAIAGF